MAVIIQFPGAINHFTIEKLAKEVMDFYEKKEIEAIKENLKKEKKEA